MFKKLLAYLAIIACSYSGNAYADDTPTEIETHTQESSKEIEEHVQQTKPTEQTTSKVSAELMAGHESSTLDVVAKGEIAPDLKFLLRSRNTWNYEQNAINMFALTDIGYNIVDLLDVIAEVQFTQGSELVPRIGARYLHEFSDLSLFFLSTVSLKKDPDCELNPIIGYSPKINEVLSVYMSLEHLTNVSKGSHNFSLQRARLGLDLKGYQFGAAADLQETGNKGELDYNVGGFVSKSF